MLTREDFMPSGGTWIRAVVVSQLPDGRRLHTGEVVLVDQAIARELIARGAATAAERPPSNRPGYCTQERGGPWR